MFVDEIRVFASAGHGGKGCVAFTREKYRPKGGPSGGNGGRGGDVILEASHDLNNLIAQFFNPRLIAQGGEPGLGKGMDGHNAKDILIKVPCGTMIWSLEAPTQTASDLEEPKIAHAETGELAQEIDLSQEAVLHVNPSSMQKSELVVDLTTDGQRHILCKGGRGGLGNRNFATSTRQAPRFAQPGESGDEGHFLFELRFIADAGFVGYPNAGKSTLLAAISHARPKIAAYPFTTLHPQIGIMEYPDWRRIVVCDVPGLVEGAHNNVGLGHQFLRHIERCKILVLLLDMAGTDGRAPWDDYRQLLKELKLYNPAMLDKPRLVVANKMDEAMAESNLKQFKQKVRRVSVLKMAAAFDVGIPEFRQQLRAALETAGEIEAAPKD